MFGRGRKSDGFEWHKHVRTTIKLRREDRRARFNDVKEVASDGLKYAGRAGVSASNSGVVVLWNGLISTIQMIIRLHSQGEMSWLERWSGRSRRLAAACPASSTHG